MQQNGVGRLFDAFNLDKSTVMMVVTNYII